MIGVMKSTSDLNDPENGKHISVSGVGAMIR